MGDKLEKQSELQISSCCKVRGSDCHGSGHYGASRGKRKHRGVDFVCTGGTLILSPCSGVVTKTKGRVYSDSNKKGWSYVEIKTSYESFARFFYVKNLDLSPGQQVEKGDVIGVAQGIEYLYEGITPHIHFEARQDKKTYFNPISYLMMLEGI